MDRFRFDVLMTTRRIFRLGPHGERDQSASRGKDRTVSTEGQFAGKVALVTGGGSGIGKATAIELGRQAASVAVLSRQQGRIDEAVAEVIAAGGQALGISADVTNEAAVQAAVRQIDETWGRLDLVVANAGANGVFSPLEELNARRVGSHHGDQPDEHLPDRAGEPAAPEVTWWSDRRHRQGRGSVRHKD